jgi:hypothetical protein
MSRLRYNFFIERWQIDAMKAVMTKDGIPVSEQLRRAITAWLKTKGVTEPTKATGRKGRA